MKKFFRQALSVTVVMLLLIGFTGCTARIVVEEEYDPNNTYVGQIANIYYLTDMQKVGYEASDFWGFYQTMEFYGNSTYEILTLDNGTYSTLTGTYEVYSDHITIYDEYDAEWSDTYNYTLVDEVLTLTTINVAEQETYVFSVDHSTSIANSYYYIASTLNDEPIVDAPDYAQNVYFYSDNTFEMVTLEYGVYDYATGGYDIIGDLLLISFSESGTIQVYEYFLSGNIFQLDYFTQSGHQAILYNVLLD